MLKMHKSKCENNDITTIRTALESHLHWQDQFHKNPLCFRIYAYFEVDNGIDFSSFGNKTTNIHKQNRVINAYHIESELEDILNSGCFKSPLG